ncbi:MAG: inositol-3-phosphate synthase [Planctomycetes bacterium]|nr:inositol-3-phosphate synthase [Planctomycetota bacterium]
MKSKKSAPPKVGVWLFGACGGLATTVVVGARAIARGLFPPQGLVTATPAADGIAWQPLEGLVFGGHEVRDSDYVTAAKEIRESTGTLSESLLQALRSDLRAASRNIRPGVMPNAGRTIESLVGSGGRGRRQSLRAQVARIERDLVEFRERHRLDRLICVNVTSTEAPLPLGPAHRTLAAFEKAIARDDLRAVRPSSIYAYATARLGLPFVHFTPSNATLTPAIRELFDRTGAPYMGCDGKTGETLVKSALAPMFKYRNLRVLSWQGYNILGDRDGRVLADEANKKAKVATKDQLLPNLLGYPLHTHVGIDYVPSLDDLKTAWDFVHFQGFLGVKMVLQFIWQGCDAILAAPLVLDLIRFADLAARRGERGPMTWLASFFKQPVDVAEHDLHRQWHALTEYLERARSDS